MLQQLRMVHPSAGSRATPMLTVTSTLMTVEIERLTEGVQDATAKLLGVRGPR